MSELYNRIESLCAEKKINVTKMCHLAGCSRAALCDLKMGRKQSLSAETLTKLASVFGVSVDYLLGNETPASARTERGVTDDDIKFALFGGDGEITDEMYQEVRNFAAFIKRREEEKKRKD